MALEVGPEAGHLGALCRGKVPDCRCLPMREAARPVRARAGARKGSEHRVSLELNERKFLSLKPGR